MYEYVALSWRTLAWCDDKRFVPSYAQLREEGWEEYIRAYFHNDIGGACIMRRPKDEPRMWMKGEIQEIARNTLCSAAMWGNMSGLAKEESNG